MRPSPFEKERGQASFLALAMISLMMSASLGQFQYVFLSFKRDGTYPRGLHKDLVLVNAPHLVRLSNLAGSGQILFKEESCSYNWIRDQTGLLDLDQIEIVFPDHPKWPRLSGLWVAGKHLDLYINDYRAR